MYQFNVPFEEVNIPFNKTDTINMVKFFPKDSVRKGVVIYFHGNKENIERYAKFAATLPNMVTKYGWKIIPALEKVLVNRNEKILYQQAVQIHKMAASKYG